MNLCVELISQILEDVAARKDEKIAFFFDRNKQFGGRAGEWYRMSVDRPLMPHHLRLGPYTQGDRMDLVGLQAADLLAYSAYRRLSDPTRERWQWRELHNASHVSMPIIGDESYFNARDRDR
jgi:hypothetical protein